MPMAMAELSNAASPRSQGPIRENAPRVLVATTARWYPTARLVLALAKAGCTVAAVCPAGHPLTKTRAGTRTYPYRGLAPLASFAAAIAKSQPDFVIPGDDLAARHMHRLYDQELKKGADSALCRLIEHSLGAAEGFPVSYTRARFMETARAEGIRVPATAVIANLDELHDWIVRHGLPVVLKADGTSGGEGVKIAQTLDEADRAFHSLQAPPQLLRAAKRALLNRDVTLVKPALLCRRFAMNAQEYVAGHEATSALICWQGTVLAVLHFEVVNKRSAAGPATVVRSIENAEMSLATEKMVRRLKLSGLHGFDFMVEEQTGHAYLIETNPRATQVGHLALGPGRDLPAALFAALSGRAVQPRAKLTENDTIALFPQEWIRDPESEFLRTAYHDIPWEEPDLVHDCVSSRYQQKSWYSRANSGRLPAVSPTPGPVASSGVRWDWEGSKSRHD